MDIGNPKSDICELEQIARGDVFEYGDNFYIKSDSDSEGRIAVVNMSNGSLEYLYPTDWVRKDHGKYTPAYFPTF